MIQSLITKYFVPIKTKTKTKNQSLIIDFIKIKDNKKYLLEQKNTQLVYGYNWKTDSWHCLECGEDMGKTNPRQLCGKTHCHNKYF